MTEIIKEQIGDNLILLMILLLALFGYFVYKEWPEFRRRVSGQTVEKKDIESRLRNIETKLDDLTAKVNRDYARLNALDNMIGCHETEIKDSLEERRLLMTGVLACLKGLKEQGCNGPVTEAITQYEKYMVDKSHERGNQHE